MSPWSSLPFAHTSNVKQSYWLVQPMCPVSVQLSDSYFITHLLYKPGILFCHWVLIVLFSKETRVILLKSKSNGSELYSILPWYPLQLKTEALVFKTLPSLFCLHFLLPSDQGSIIAYTAHFDS